MDEKKRAMDFLCSFGNDDKTPKKDKKSKKEKKDKVSKEGEDTAKADAPEDEVNDPFSSKFQASAVPELQAAPGTEPEVSSKASTSKALPAVKSILYEEDVFEDGHTSVWGSLWEPTSNLERWGYACCRSFTRHKDCVLSVSVPAGAGASSFIDARTCSTDLPSWEASMLKDKMDDDAMSSDAKILRKKRRMQEFKVMFVDSEREEFRQIAAKIELSECGSQVELPESMGGSGVPLRIFTRREDCAWEWAGKLQPRLDGGGDSADEW